MGSLKEKLPFLVFASFIQLRLTLTGGEIKSFKASPCSRRRAIPAFGSNVGNSTAFANRLGLVGPEFPKFQAT